MQNKKTVQKRIKPASYRLLSRSSASNLAAIALLLTLMFGLHSISQRALNRHRESATATGFITIESQPTAFAVARGEVEFIETAPLLPVAAKSSGGFELCDLNPLTLSTESAIASGNFELTTIASASAGYEITAADKIIAEESTAISGKPAASAAGTFEIVEFDQPQDIAATMAIAAYELVEPQEPVISQAIALASGSFDLVDRELTEVTPQLIASGGYELKEIPAEQPDIVITLASKAAGSFEIVEIEKIEIAEITPEIPTKAIGSFELIDREIAPLAIARAGFEILPLERTADIPQLGPKNENEVEAIVKPSQTEIAVKKPETMEVVSKKTPISVTRYRARKPLPKTTIADKELDVSVLDNERARQSYLASSKISTRIEPVKVASPIIKSAPRETESPKSPGFVRFEREFRD